MSTDFPEATIQKIFWTRVAVTRFSRIQNVNVFDILKTKYFEIRYRTKSVERKRKRNGERSPFAGGHPSASNFF